MRRTVIVPCAAVLVMCGACKPKGDSSVATEAEGEFEVGTRIWLILPGRERANALIRWIAGNRIGAEFAEPISLDGLNA